jgi:AcrR family transcriptional regulator
MVRTHVEPEAGGPRKSCGSSLALFGERGIDAASMDAIAEKSGVSKATIYKHWQDGMRWPSKPCR